MPTFSKEAVLTIFRSFFDHSSVDKQNEACWYLSMYLRSHDVWNFSMQILTEYEDHEPPIVCLAIATLKFRIRARAEEMPAFLNAMMLGTLADILKNIIKSQRSEWKTVSYLLCSTVGIFALLSCTPEIQIDKFIEEFSESAPLELLVVFESIALEAIEQKSVDKLLYLSRHRNRVARVLKTCLKRTDLKHAERYCFRCYTAWTRTEVFKVDQITRSPVLFAAFKRLMRPPTRSQTRLFEEATDCVIEALEHLRQLAEFGWERDFRAEVQIFGAVRNLRDALMYCSPEHQQKFSDIFLQVSITFALPSVDVAHQALAKRGPRCFEMLALLMEQCDTEIVLSTLDQWHWLAAMLTRNLNSKYIEAYKPIIERFIQSIQRHVRLLPGKFATPEKMSAVEDVRKAYCSIVVLFAQIVPVDVMFKKLLRQLFVVGIDWIDTEGVVFCLIPIIGELNECHNYLFDLIIQSLMMWLEPGVLVDVVLNQFVVAITDCLKYSTNLLNLNEFLTLIVEFRQMKNARLSSVAEWALDELMRTRAADIDKLRS